MSELSHLNAAGEAQMVDIGAKEITAREAIAEGRVSMQSETLALIEEGGHKKGDVFAVARIAGIQAAKKCADLIPLCHPLALTAVEVELVCNHQAAEVVIRANCRVSGRTGVEMEALTAVCVAGLTVYDMCKAVDKGMRLGDIRLVHKSGGKSGIYEAE